MTQERREMLRGELVSVLQKYTEVDLVIENAIDDLIGDIEDADEPQEDPKQEAIDSIVKTSERSINYSSY